MKRRTAACAVFVFLAFAGHISAQNCRAPLEVVRGCNLWVRDGLSVNAGAVRGKVCVGGSLSAGEDFSYGEAAGSVASCTDCCVDGPFSLVVAGDVKRASGRTDWLPQCVGGQVQDPVLSENCPGDSTSQRCSELIDFESDYNNLIALADALQAGPTGFQPSVAVAEHAEIRFFLDARSPKHVVSLNATLIDGFDTWGFTVKATHGSLDNVELVIVNLHDVPKEGLFIARRFAYREQLGANRVLFNYNGTSDISLAIGSVLEGSLLAPRASLGGNSHGGVNGQLIVRSYQVSPTSLASVFVTNTSLASPCVEGLPEAKPTVSSPVKVPPSAPPSSESPQGSKPPDLTSSSVNPGGAPLEILIGVGVAVVLLLVMVAVVLERRRAAVESAPVEGGEGGGPSVVVQGRSPPREGEEGDGTPAARNRYPGHRRSTRMSSIRGSISNMVRRMSVLTATPRSRAYTMAAEDQDGMLQGPRGIERPGTGGAPSLAWASPTSASGAAGLGSRTLVVAADTHDTAWEGGEGSPRNADSGVTARPNSGQQHEPAERPRNGAGVLSTPSNGAARWPEQRSRLP